MAGEASHVLFAIPEGAIDSTHHNDHSASSHLLDLCVRGAVFHVAKAAGSFIQEAQRLYERLHRGRQVGSLEYLDVFPATSASAPTATATTSKTPTSTTLTSTTPPRATPTRATGSRDSESAGSPGENLGNYRDLLVSEIRTQSFHTSDGGGPTVTVRLLAINAIQRVARSADSVDEVCRYRIGPPGSGRRAIGRLGQNRERNEHEACGKPQGEFCHGGNYTKLAAEGKPSSPGD